jgi:hypothetical protein
MSNKYFSIRISYTGIPLGFVYPNIFELGLTCTFQFAICLVSVFRMILSIDLSTELAVISKVLTHLPNWHMSILEKLFSVK